MLFSCVAPDEEADSTGGTLPIRICTILAYPNVTRPDRQDGGLSSTEIQCPR